VDVAVQGGRLRVHFTDSGREFGGLRLEGPAEVAYRGELDWAG
jgi:hypothetical protein